MSNHKRLKSVVWRLSNLLLVSAILSSCGESDGVAPVVTRRPEKPTKMALGASRREPQYLPYGTTVLDTGVITAIPEPYNSNRHGPTIADTHPELNEATRVSVHGPGHGLPTNRVEFAPAPSFTGNTDSWYGYRLLLGRGIYAGYDLPDPPQVTTPNPPSDWVTYTPTALPAGRSCVEVTGAHFGDHNGWGVPYNDAFGVFDWCNKAPDNQYEFRYWANTTVYAFRDPYVRTYTDEYGLTKKAYWVQAWAHNAQASPGTYDCWETDLYNFNLGRWEEKWTSCGTGSVLADNYGWVMHETRHLSATYNSTCYSQKSVKADYLQVWGPYLTDGSWFGLASTLLGGPIFDQLPENSSNICFANGTWSMWEWTQGPVGWRALTPSYVW